MKINGPTLEVEWSRAILDSRFGLEQFKKRLCVDEAVEELALYGGEVRKIS